MTTGTAARDTQSLRVDAMLLSMMSDVPDRPTHIFEDLRHRRLRLGHMVDRQNGVPSAQQGGGHPGAEAIRTGFPTPADHQGHSEPVGILGLDHVVREFMAVALPVGHPLNRGERRMVVEPYSGSQCRQSQD